MRKNVRYAPRTTIMRVPTPTADLLRNVHDKCKFRVTLSSLTEQAILEGLDSVCQTLGVKPETKKETNA